MMPPPRQLSDFMFYYSPPAPSTPHRTDSVLLLDHGRHALASGLLSLLLSLPGTHFLKDQCGQIPWIFPQMPPSPGSISCPPYLNCTTTSTLLPIQLFCFPYSLGLIKYPPFTYLLCLCLHYQTESSTMSQGFVYFYSPLCSQHPRQRLVNN